MDRISFTQHTQPTTQNAALARTPKLIDPSARLRIADRADTAELSSVSKSKQVQKAVAADSVERLIAARVVAPATKAEALKSVEEVASDAAGAIVSQLIGKKASAADIKKAVADAI